MTYNVLVYRTEQGRIFVDFRTLDPNGNTMHVISRPVADTRNLAIACFNWCNYGHAPDNTNTELIVEKP